jgi:hypothetical protein
VCVKKYIESCSVESLVELGSDAACFDAAVADKKAALLAKKPETFEDSRRKSFEIRAALGK